MKSTRKIAAIILAFMICVTLLSGTEAFAAGENVFYTADLGGTLAIRGVEVNDSNGNVTVPSQIDGKTVSEISNKAFANPQIKSITIPASVIKVGARAFDANYALRSVTFISGIEKVEIGINAFRSCTALTSVTLPSTLEKIPANCFEGCTALNSLTVPASVKVIENNAFFKCTGITDYYVDSSSTSFKAVNGAIYTYDGSELVQYPCGRTATTFTVPSDVRTIGVSAFAYAPLKSVTLPAGLKTVGAYAFYYCTKLESVTLPSGLQTIGDSAFSNCKSLKSIVIPGSVTEMENAFSYSSLESVEIEAGVKNISLNAFQHSKSLKTVTLNSGLTSIDNGAFYDCTGLSRIYIPSTVTSIDNMAFGLIPDLTITSDSSSAYAAAFAASKGYKFEVEGGSPETPTEPTHTHSYSVSSTVDATCTQPGKKTYTCSCGDSYTEEIPALGHSFSAWHYNGDATVDADGTETATCSRCGYSETRAAYGTRLSSNINLKIENNPVSRNLSYGYTLVLKAKSDSSTCTYRWTVSGEGVTIVTEGARNEICKVTVSGSGTATITLSSDATGETDSETVEARSNILLRIIAFFKKLFRMDMTIYQ